MAQTDKEKQKNFNIEIVLITQLYRHSLDLASKSSAFTQAVIDSTINAIDDMDRSGTCCNSDMIPGRISSPVSYGFISRQSLQEISNFF